MEIFDHISLIKKRLAARFSDATVTKDYIAALLSEAQYLEKAFSDIGSVRNIDNASGDALRSVGLVVGVEHSFISSLLGYNATDEELRLYIKAKIAKNWSDHSVDSVISAIMYIIDVSTVNITEQGGAVVLIEFNRPLTPAEQAVLIDLDMIPKVAGVRYTYIVPTTEASFGFVGTTNTLGFGDENTPGSGGTFLSEL